MQGKGNDDACIFKLYNIFHSIHVAAGLDFKVNYRQIKKTTSNSELEIFVDLAISDYKCTSELFESSRPDIAVKSGNRLTVIELTVCFETNTEKSRRYKQTKYQNLKNELVVECEELKLIFLEVTTLGFLSKSSYQDFNKFLVDLGVNAERTFIKCMETAIRATYYIFCRRNKDWSSPELLHFY